MKNKCKIISKLGITQLVIKSQKGQQLSEREVYDINGNQNSGLLSLHVVTKGSSFKLIYDITGFITFKEYLKKPLTRESFAHILKNILENLNAVQKLFINQQMLWLDFEHVLVNPATGRIYFTCVPIRDIETETPLRDFLLNIIQYSTFVPGEDNSYIKEYITILNSGINFSVFDLEEYINGLNGKSGQSEKQTKECPGCRQTIMRGTNYCPHCGAKVIGFTEDAGTRVYDPLQDEFADEIDAEHRRGTQDLSYGTTVLGADPGGTTVLGSEELDAPVFPYLIRKKNQEKIEELQLFIQRFSANKAKAKQATARRKLLDKLSVEEMPSSTRRYPFVGFMPERELGKDVLTVKDVSVTVDGVKLLDNVYFSVGRTDKIAFVGENELAQTALFKVLMGELEPDEGSVKWGVSTIRSYLPKDNSPYFDGNEEELVDWLRQYSAKKDDVYLRGFLGRMLFSNEDVFKHVNVLSGGEKVRCMLSKMMLSGANVVLLDQPTNHLDMESIQAVNKGLEAFTGVVLLASHDHELLTSTCNRVIAFQPDGTIVDRYGTYDDYLNWLAEQKNQ